MVEAEHQGRRVAFETTAFGKERPDQFARLETCIRLGFSVAGRATAPTFAWLTSRLADLCESNKSILLTPDLKDIPGAESGAALNGYAWFEGMDLSTPVKKRSSPRIWLAAVGSQAPGNHMPIAAVMNFFWHEALHLVADFTHTKMPKDYSVPENVKWRDTMTALAKELPSKITDPVTGKPATLYDPEAWF